MHFLYLKVCVCVCDLAVWVCVAGVVVLENLGHLL